MADRKINAVTSTSVGRLFDAVSAILGIRRQSGFEGRSIDSVTICCRSIRTTAKHFTGTK
ncbi:MAG: hypothetical protein ACLVI9_05925 [Anaerostipes hadrus]